MADNKKDQKSISAAPVVITTPVAPAVASRGAVHLKGTTESRLRREEQIVQPLPADAPKSEQDIAFQRFIHLDLINYGQELTALSLNDWVKDNAANLGKYFDPKDPIDRSYADFQRNNPSDRRVTSAYETSVFTPFVHNPRNHSSVLSPNSIIDDGFKAPAFKLSKNEARTALAADIKTVSEMYAADAGMSAKDFAKVMGGIATIESSFGVLRSVSGTKYASSAGGAFHYLDGTIAGEVKQNMNDPRIANRVAKLDVNIKDGIAKSEAWTMKEDNILAGSILAKRIIATARANPELKNNIEALATRVYQSHNLGDAGARALAQGGVDALNAKDSRATANNPMFFRGANSDAEVHGRYNKFVSKAVTSADTLIETAFASSASATATIAIAKASASSKADLRIPAPEPT
ncbi:MAG TPA: hypothetical protein DCM27_05500 [Rhodospirillaceae bacterium]|nr:hypothetical protein [Rhodospirillaceae bacterium]